MPILPKYRSDFTNKAEKEIFQKAIDSKYFDSPKKYFIHSLRNHNAKNKIVGEIDFVYLDDQFIIFLESKGGAVKYDSSNDQWWVLGGTKKGDPFAQVTSYLFYVRNTLIPKYFPEENYQNKLIFGYGVMFPDVERKLSFNKKTKTSGAFKHETIEYDPEIIYSASNHAESNGLVKYIEHLKQYWMNHDKYTSRNRTYGIGLQGLDSIRKVFRKDLVFEIPLGKVINSEGENIKQFTEEQFTVLDTFDLIKNRGLVVIGGPGTGKTVLAKELIHRQNLESKKCAYFCYNKNLAGELSRYFSQTDSDKNVEVYHIHGFLHDKLKEKELLPVRTGNENEYWDTLLPQQFKMWYSSLNVEKFDFIVIDEAQDIFQEELIDSVFLNLKNGVESGNWSIFIDPKYQRFYKGFDEDYYNLFLNTYPCIPQHLPLNCRNHPNIIDVASIHSGMDTMPCRRNEIPFKTTTVFYNEDTDLIKYVNHQINEWLGNGVNANQITVLVLSNHKLKFLQENISSPNHIVSEKSNSIEGSISLSTIHGYKGLENEFVCVAGIEEYDRNNKELMSLLFVSYSRAKMGLAVFMNEKIQGPLALSITKV